MTNLKRRVKKWTWDLPEALIIQLQHLVTFAPCGSMLTAHLHVRLLQWLDASSQVSEENHNISELMHLFLRNEPWNSFEEPREPNAITWNAIIPSSTLTDPAPCPSKLTQRQKNFDYIPLQHKETEKHMNKHQCSKQDFNLQSQCTGGLWPLAQPLGLALLTKISWQLTDLLPGSQIVAGN